MPLALYLIRHERRNPTDRTFHSPLLPEGQCGAERLAREAMLPHVHVLYTSPFQRCLETLAPFVRRRPRSAPPLRARVEYALYERIAAETEADRLRGEVAFDPENFVHSVPEDSPHRELLDARYTSWLPPHAITWDESVEDVGARAVAFLQHLQREHGAGDELVNVVVVSHLSVLNAMLGRPDEAEFPMGGILRVPSAANVDTQN